MMNRYEFSSTSANLSDSLSPAKTAATCQLPFNSVAGRQSIGATCTSKAFPGPVLTSSYSKSSSVPGLVRQVSLIVHDARGRLRTRSHTCQAPTAKAPGANIAAIHVAMSVEGTPIGSAVLDARSYEQRHDLRLAVLVGDDGPGVELPADREDCFGHEREVVVAAGESEVEARHVQHGREYRSALVPCGLSVVADLAGLLVLDESHGANHDSSQPVSVTFPQPVLPVVQDVLAEVGDRAGELSDTLGEFAHVLGGRHGVAAAAVCFDAAGDRLNATCDVHGVGSGHGDSSEVRGVDGVRPVDAGERTVGEATDIDPLVAGGCGSCGCSTSELGSLAGSDLDGPVGEVPPTLPGRAGQERAL